MTFTDLFIKRPVLATVVSLFLLLVGFNAYQQLSIREYPEVEDATVTITTVYVGADADLVQGFITTPIQSAIAGAEGIAYITSTSTSGLSTIVAYIQPGFSADDALTEIIAKSAEIRGQLPEGVEDSVIVKGETIGTSLMYLSFSDDQMSFPQISDYLKRVVQPQMVTLEGVAEANIFGEKEFAMRIWLNPERMAALNVTAAEVNLAINRSNFLSTSGDIKGQLVMAQVQAKTDISNVADFEAIVVRNDGDRLVRLSDVADVELSTNNFSSSAYTAGKPIMVMGVSATPGSNPLEVAQRVRDQMEVIKAQVPEGMEAEVMYDISEFIESSISEVISTLLEASLIVVLVVFLFLGQARSVVIPIVAIPLSLVGTLFLMWLAGYSINLLTLLALVLSIGLVVDDAIVVVENIHRHIEEGMKPLKAALQGAREIAMPVISMTLTLAAVYAPLGFLQGLTGALFKEFAFTLAGAVIISGLVALTLSPMMCSKLLRHSEEKGFAVWVDRQFARLMQAYKRQLARNFRFRPVTLVFAILILCTIPMLLSFSSSELAPEEDNGFLFILNTFPQSANINYVEKYTAQYNDVFQSIPEQEKSFVINNEGAGFNVGILLLKPWDQRERTAMDIQPEVQASLNQISGVSPYVLILPTLPGASSGGAVQVVIKSNSDYRLLSEISSELLAEAQKSGLFLYIDSDLKYNKPQLQVDIDRDRAAQLGVSIQSIAQTLSTLLGEGQIGRFALDGRSYEVIPQAANFARESSDWLNRYYVRTSSGDQVPLSSLIRISTTVQPSSLNQFQQLNSVTLSGAPGLGVNLSTALEFINEKAAEILPSGFALDFDGESRQYYQEGNQLYVIFFISLLAIYLVLAAQFESFRDPIIILVSVPMSICGALIPIALGLMTLNIYSQIGLITLIGLISKHGILIVEFANRLQEQGVPLKEAVIEAASVRLRPVLMTTAAMVMGVIPLILATGAGAVSRFNIGLVIATGMTIGTMFTLFVVPVMYSYLARDHSLHAQEIEGEHPGLVS